MKENGMSRKSQRGAASLALVVLIAYLLAPFYLPGMVGAGREVIPPIPQGPVAPVSLRKASPPQDHAPGTEAVESWADMRLPNWKTQGKVTAPRVCLAKLWMGRDVEEVNRYLRDAVPWAGSGSTWSAHKGDYDFTETTLTTILYLFGHQPDLLHPETVAHLLDVLLVEEGGAPRLMVPRSMDMILDTENHHLMTEGSRYLKNQWLFSHGGPGREGNPLYDNRTNGLEAWMVAHLEEIRDHGVYEFNSQPYLGYTVQALLNLEAFPESEEVRGLARLALDTMNAQYAVGSLDFRRCAPYRRRLEKGMNPLLANDPHTQVMRVWCAPESKTLAVASRGDGHQALLAAVMPYQLPPAFRAWTLAKPREYFVKIGRGLGASPEIYSGSPDFLLGSGGVFRGLRASIVARPTTLLLRDRAPDLSGCFHIPGQGRWWHWNNTGVHRRFAVGNYPVSIPENYPPVVKEGAWSVHAPECAPGLLIVVHNAENFGLLALFPESVETPQALLDRVRAANPEEGSVRRRFVWPGGAALGYDVNARRGVWPITEVAGKTVERDYDLWPQWDGDNVLDDAA